MNETQLKLILCNTAAVFELFVTLVTYY